MDEKKRNIYIGCRLIGIVALLIYIILSVVGRNRVLLVLKILFTGIALIAYAIRLGIEVSIDESYENSVYIIAVCLLTIVVTAMLL